MKRNSSTAVHSDSAPPVHANKKRKIQSAPTSPTRFVAGHVVHEDEDFVFEFLYNDKKEEHWIALCDLKQIFAACLPRMGSRYVTRHVFDRHHRLLCCRSKKKATSTTVHQQQQHSVNIPENFPVERPIIGGICIRPFYAQRFGEVVFLAVHNQYQHQSVGRKIMRVMKQVAVDEGLLRYYTYADNQAIGFFQKMGFVKKKCSSPKDGAAAKEPFWDFIKHYTGSELMECRLYPKVDYILLDRRLAALERDILTQCHRFRRQQFGREMEVVYDPPPSFLIPVSKLIVILELEDDFERDDEEELLIDMLRDFGVETDRDLYDVYFTKKARGKEVGSLQDALSGLFGAKRGSTIFRKFELYLTRPNDKLAFDHIDVLHSIEGVKEQWTPTATKNSGRPPANNQHHKRRSSRFSAFTMKANYVLKRLRKHEDAYPFAEPVPKTVEGYYERIKQPMDLQTIQSKMDQGQYPEWRNLQSDFKLMISNCKEFNEPGSEIVKMCVRLDEYYQQCSLKYDTTMKRKEK